MDGRFLLITTHPLHEARSVRRSPSAVGLAAPLPPSFGPFFFDPAQAASSGGHTGPTQEAAEPPASDRLRNEIQESLDGIKQVLRG